MRISGEEYLRASQSVVSVRRAADAFSRSNVAVAPAQAPPSVSAQVEFSPEAKDVQRIVNRIKSEPDVREEVVASLRARIEGGTYNVSGVEIGEMMVRRMLADRVA